MCSSHSWTVELSVWSLTTTYYCLVLDPGVLGFSAHHHFDRHRHQCMNVSFLNVSESNLYRLYHFVVILWNRKMFVWLANVCAPLQNNVEFVWIPNRLFIWQSWIKTGRFIRFAFRQVSKVYCVCRQPEGGKIIQCNTCSEWFHNLCIRANSLVWKKLRFRMVL